MSLWRSSARISSLAALAVLLTALTATGGGTPAEAAPAPMARAVGGPDGWGYRFMDSAENGGPVFSQEWEDISTTGTSLFGVGSDDSATSVSFPSGFQFRFYGNNYSSMWVVTNGNIQFGSSGNTTYSNQAMIYSPMGEMIAPYWDDLYVGSNSTIRWQRFDAGGANDRIIVQWTLIDFCCSSGNGQFTFQVKLYGGTGSDGKIMLNYNAMNNQTGSGATIGIQSVSRNTSLTYGYSGSPNGVANSRSVRIANNQPPNPPTNLIQAGTSGGAPLPLGSWSDTTIYCRGTVTDPDASNTVGLEIEILPNSTAFSSNITGQTASTPGASMVANGGTPEALYTFTGNPYGSGDYHWRARSRDSAGATSAWVVFDASGINFSVDLTPPSAPTGPFFPNAVQEIGTEPFPTVDFTWGPATDIGPPSPLSYMVEIASSNAFLTTIFAGTSPTTSASAVVPASDVDYFWRVSAVDQAGNQGPWAGPFAFQVGFIEQFPKPPDKYAYCGADSPANPWGLVAMTGALALLAGALLRRRPAA
jgi:hypothetical protein